MEVLPIQLGTFDGLTLELAFGFDRVQFEKAVIVGRTCHGKHGSGRARQQPVSHIFPDRC